MSPAASVSEFVGALPRRSNELFPGVIMAVIVAVTAQFLADHYEAPAMLMALLLGIAVAFLGDEGKTVAGISFAARTVLRMGIAFLGVRISFDLMAGLGLDVVLLVVGAVLATIAFGLLISRFFGHGWRFAFLTAGSVAICGASAAMAISAILPKDEKSEQRLIFTVLGVTVLSTIAMIAYPILVTRLGLGETAGGIFLGATIHDVAQVVGAGFSVSEGAGDTATLIKLIRVSMLAPVVLVGALLIRTFAEASDDDTRPPLLPVFVIGFLALATINSLGLIPTQVADFVSQMSRWMLLVAIAAVGMKTNLKRVLAVGGPAIALLITETVFIAGLVLVGIYYFA
ncbi:MAG: putative sulfate exporter family transporter [Pseudomonadota bacterium]